MGHEAARLKHTICRKVMSRVNAKCSHLFLSFLSFYIVREVLLSNIESNERERKRERERGAETALLH